MMGKLHDGELHNSCTSCSTGSYMEEDEIGWALSTFGRYNTCTGNLVCALTGRMGTCSHALAHCFPPNLRYAARCLLACLARAPYFSWLFVLEIRTNTAVSVVKYGIKNEI